MRRITVVFVLPLFLLYSCCSRECPHKEEQKAKNIILLIGDGMGLSQVSATYYYGQDSSVFRFFKNIGIINTSSASHKITDSGAGGTAFSIGKRTYNGAIGVGMDSLPSENICEILSQKGYLTGVVATSSVTHATPAVFYAHVKNREKHEDIAVQLLHSGIDFFAASGIRYFTQRKDGINYLDSFPKYGFLVDTTKIPAPGHFDMSKKYGCLLYPKSLPKASEGRGDFLPKATESAISYLSSGEKGFFLMVEGSQIDWAGHDNDADYLISELSDFEKAIRVALDFARKDGNTLVIVLADHECGGFTLSSPGGYDDDKADYNVIVPSFSTKGHSAALVPVFAWGPESKLFGGVYDNIEIFGRMLQSLGIR